MTKSLCHVVYYQISHYNCTGGFRTIINVENSIVCCHCHSINCQWLLTNWLLVIHSRIVYLHYFIARFSISPLTTHRLRLSTNKLYTVNIRYKQTQYKQKFGIDRSCGGPVRFMDLYPMDLYARLVRYKQIQYKQNLAISWLFVVTNHWNAFQY